MTKAHRDAVIEMGCDSATTQSLAVGTTRGPSATSRLRCNRRHWLQAAACSRCQTIELHDAQFETVHHSFAFREGRGDGQNRIFIDHRRAFPAERQRPSAWRPSPRKIGDILAAGKTGIEHFDIGAHFCNVRIRPVRVGFISTLRMVTSGTFDQKGGNERESR